MSSRKPVYKPTDYAKGTILEPEHVSTLKASFNEYEVLGQKHRELSEQIEALQEKMKLSRQRGAFQALQNQMREIKNLVKEREDIDAKMVVQDLARKKDDEHRLAAGQEVSYSEKLSSLTDRIAALESLAFEYAEMLESDTF